MQNSGRQIPLSNVNIDNYIYECTPTVLNHHQKELLTVTL